MEASPSSRYGTSVVLERAQISLLLRGDRTARAYDQFLSAEHVNGEAATLLARPLPTRMNRPSCIIRHSNVPVFAYRVDEPVWALGTGASLSAAALGEQVTVMGKNELISWKGTLLHGDTARLVLYHSTSKSTSIIDARHVHSVTIEKVPQSEASYYANSNVCVLEIGRGRQRTSSFGRAAVELAYDLEPSAITFQVFHVVSFDGAKNSLALESFVEISNELGVHLLNAIVRVRQRRSEYVVVRALYAEAAAAGGTTEESAVAPRRSRGLWQQAATAAQPPPPSLSSSEEVLEVQLNDAQSALHLAPSSSTKVSAFSAAEVPATLRYLLRMNAPCSAGTPTLDVSAYSDALRTISFSRADITSRSNGRQLLSGLATVQDVLAGDGPLLSEQPCALDAWQNLTSGRMRLDLGPNSGVHWRCYVENEQVDPKQSLRTQDVRLDVLCTPSTTPGVVRFKLEMVTEQPRVVPKLSKIFRRHSAAPATTDESLLLLPRAYRDESLSEAQQKYWIQLAQNGPSPVLEHDEESDDARVDHQRKDFVHAFETGPDDIEAYQKHRMPLMLSYYFTVQYSLMMA